MQKTGENSLKSTDLRKRAEAFLEKTPSTVKEMPAEDIKGLIEELRIHQVELEMQGDELRRSQEELEDARDRYLDLYDFAPVGYFTVSEEGIILEANLTAATLLGVVRSALVGMPFSRFIVKEDKDLFYFHRRKLLESRDRERCELKFVKQDGQEFYAGLEWVYVEKPEQAFKGFRISLIDIHEKKKAEMALAESEWQKALILNSTTARIFFVDKGLKVKWANRVAGELAGLAETALVERPCYEIWQQRDAPCEKCPVLSAIETGEPMEGEVMDPHGTSWFLRAYPAFGEKGELLGITEVAHDITKQKELEAQLRQAQKMEAVGSLAGGIAHDFNNILAVILGNAELALDDVRPPNPAGECLKEICIAAIRAKEMVQQLLAFSRKTGLVTNPVDVTPIIRDAVKMLRSAIPASVVFKEHIGEDPCVVLGDTAQINQIMMNLVTNAAQAMPEERGLVEVALENRLLLKKTPCFNWVLPPGHYVKLSVRDTGEGMGPDIMDRIFDPYYTTKGVGKGTGMGLSVVHGIVKRHGGGIRVMSEPGKGTLFEVYFPAVKKTIEEKIESAENIRGGSESILFVDDEASIVNLNHKRLERLGYRVKSTLEPEEALEWFRADPKGFDLIITDMTMPGITGDRLTKEILKIRPHMPIILCTGYSERISAKETAALGVRKYLEKPITAGEMASAIRKVLEVPSIKANVTTQEPSD